MGTVRATLHDLGPRTAASRVAMLAAAAWGISALFHLAVFLVDGGSWSGAVSWRKPVVFSLSVGSLMWVVGWVIDRLPRRPRLAAWTAGAFVVSGSIETALIVAQTWRGVPSHFNTAAPENAVVFGLMGAMVGVMSIALLVLTVWAVVERPRERDLRLAMLGGMAMVLAGLGIGQWIIDLGVAYVEQHGVVPDVVLNGEAGVVKFPHAVAFHGIHLFAVLAALGRVRTLSERRRTTGMRLAVGAYAGLLAFATAQTYAGQAPFDVGTWAALAVTGAAGILAAVFVRALTGAGEPAGPALAPSPVGAPADH